MKKVFCWVAVGIYILSIFGGYSVGSVDLVHQEEFENAPESKVLMDPISIYKNNIKSVFANLFGFFSLGIGSVVNTAMSGAVLGFFIRQAVIAEKGPSFVLKSIMPQFLEYFAICLSCVAGLSGITFLKKDSDKLLLFEDFSKLAVIAHLLILIAAYMEVWGAKTF